MSEVVLAGDLGGTNLRIAAIDTEGRIVHRAEAETPRGDDESDIVEAIKRLAAECLERPGRQPRAFGLAIPAIMNAQEGQIFISPNLPELNGKDLSSRLKSELGIRVLLENDANAAAIGESWLGASRGFDNSICITLGTGVGGGIIIGGEPLRGPDGTAGEIGHICVEPLGPPCGCGSNGCLEQFSSASAIVRMAKELLPEYPGSGFRDAEVSEASRIYELGAAGDALCVEVFRRVGMYLGIAIAGLVNVLNPEVIVIGGGAAKGWDLFAGPMREEIAKRAFREPNVLESFAPNSGATQD
jgi:glucokinase